MCGSHFFFDRADALRGAHFFVDCVDGCLHERCISLRFVVADDASLLLMLVPSVGVDGRISTALVEISFRTDWD